MMINLVEIYDAGVKCFANKGCVWRSRSTEFQDRYHDGLPNIKISEAPMGPFVLADEDTKVLWVVGKHLPDMASCKIRPGGLWKSQVPTTVVLIVSSIISWFDKYQVKHFFPAPSISHCPLLSARSCGSAG